MSKHKTAAEWGGRIRDGLKLTMGEVGELVADLAACEAELVLANNTVTDCETRMADEEVAVMVSQLENEFPEAARFHDLLEKEAKYDALLAVLGRCVRVMERHAGSAACLLWTRDKENDAALAAAREYTEGEKETGK